LLPVEEEAMRTRAGHVSRRRWEWAGALVVASWGLLAATPALAQTSERISINGYSSFEWEYQLSNHDTGRGDKNASFDADLFDIVLNVQATDRLRVASDLTWEHGAATEDNRGNVAAEYAFAEFQIRDALRLRAGKMFIPFGIYNEIHTAKPAFLQIDEPYATNKPERLGAPGRFYARWGTGLEAVGQLHRGGFNADYSLLVFNGESEAVNPFEEDDNGAKAVAARVRLEPHPTLTIGASFYTDRRNVYDEAGEDTGARVTQQAVGASVEWRPDATGIEVEWVRGRVPDAGTARATGNGVSIVLSQRIGRHVTPYLQYQHLDPNADVADDAANVYLGGVNLRIDRGLFVKFEIGRYDGGQANTRLGGESYTQAAGAVVVGF
jgi:hypothetical protein